MLLAEEKKRDRPTLTMEQTKKDDYLCGEKSQKKGERPNPCTPFTNKQRRSSLAVCEEGNAIPSGGKKGRGDSLRAAEERQGPSSARPAIKKGEKSRCVCPVGKKNRPYAINPEKHVVERRKKRKFRRMGSDDSEAKVGQNDPPHRNKRKFLQRY